MCVTDRHDMTLDVKVALNPNTANTASPFLTVFSKDLLCRHVKTRVCMGKS